MYEDRQSVDRRCSEEADEEWKGKLQFEVGLCSISLDCVKLLIQETRRYERIRLREITLLQTISSTGDDRGQPRLDVKRTGHLSRIEGRRGVRAESFLTISYTGRGALEVGRIR